MKKIILRILVLILVGKNGLAQNNKVELAIGEKVSKLIKLGDSDSYQIELKKNQFALLNLKQIGIDLKITTYAPNDKEIEEFDSPNGNNGNEIILIDALSNGRYEIKVTTLGEDKKYKKGNYEIKLIGINDSVKSHLNNTLKTLYDRNHIPGFGVSILNAEKILYQNAMGYANMKDKVPYTIETVQNIASISKTFIGLSLMKLVEQEKLTLDTPINELLPFKIVNPYFPNNLITIRHLATHTSTINEQGFYHKAYILQDKEALGKYDYHKHFLKELNSAKKNKRLPMSDFLKRHLSVEGKDFKKKSFFKAKPGEDWYYSNTGAALAALIVEYVSGVPYDEFVQQNILNPLQLESAAWSGKVTDKYTLATQYDFRRNPLPKRTIVTYPDGEMYINISDLSKYVMSYINGNIGKNGIVGNVYLKEMMKVQHEQMEGDFKGRRDGLFWEHSKSGVMGHSGGDYGVSAFMYLDPTTNLGFTYVCNIMPLESDYSNAESRSIWAVLKRYANFIHRSN
ncbi:serine hydrolase [Flagellimonas pacifica]|uniref:CubicO group peptidase, beta-lactamase class C family n=1 Tax=Flagellimonas pacifica TaxID=1247520 RepID=A0A285MX82_9FLAO|nr:serine hydrolase [Allomuricauda parva]SNZ01785.1 CubicO group peptidase, beta-lactamase class C family [Allomuricauda parva]